MKRTEAAGSPALFDTLHRTVSELDSMLQAPHTPRSVAETARTHELAQELETAGQNAFGRTGSGASRRTARSVSRESVAPTAPPVVPKRRPANRTIPVLPA